MSTTTTGIAGVVKKAELWLNPLHIILIMLLVGASLTGVYLYESKRADVAEAKAQAQGLVVEALKQAAAASAVQNAAQQAQSKATIEAMQAANAQLVTANQQLQSANAQLVTKLVTQQKKDATLPPSGQAQRWEQLVPQAQVSVTPTGFAIDSRGGLATIVALEEIPVDRQRIANFTKELADDEQEIANDIVSFNSEKAAHASDLANSQKQLAEANANTKKVQDDFNAYKHKARRNYIRWFLAGVIVGAVGAHAAGI
jgi:hypothetical protein